MKRRLLVTVLKSAVLLAILAWLLYSLDHAQLAALREQSVDWLRLGAGAGLALCCTLLTFVRWYLLVRALELPFRLADAFRLGCLGYLLNFVAFGSVGGDLFKAIALARRQAGRRTEAVATVALDRAVGLYSLLVVASLAILLSGHRITAPVVKAVCQLTLLATLAGSVVVVVLLAPGARRLAWLRAAARLPGLGSLVNRLADALDMYRGKRRLLAIIAGLSLTVHLVFSLALYLVGASLFPQHPTLAEHYVIVPLSVVAGALPFTPAGLGTFEAAMRELYRLVPAQSGGDGFVVALVFRLITVLIAAVGAVYYWLGRRDVAVVLREAKEEEAELSAEQVSALAP